MSAPTGAYELSMSEDTPRKELEEATRRSRRALPFAACFAGAIAAVVWALHAWLRFPTWIAWLVSCLAGFRAAGDAVNLLYGRRALRVLTAMGGARSSAAAFELPPGAVRFESVQDEVLGSLAWEDGQEAWVARVSNSPTPFRILLAGEERPIPILVSHARDIFTSPENLVSDVDLLLRRAAIEFPTVATEILSLRIEAVSLMCADRPDDGMIYFDGSGTEGRVWRCDYIGRRVQGLGFDD
jgi:hypothetical protein